MRNLERWMPRREQQGPSEQWGVAVSGTLDEPRWIIPASSRLDAQDCALICATHNAAIAQSEERAIWCESLVNRQGAPIVQITLGSEVAQLDIRHARLHLSALYEAIEAAMTDAVLVRFIREYVYRDRADEEAHQAVATLLMMFRDFREALSGKAP